eukprot:5005682-Pyramimonas_sp.AAC.1
MPLATFGYVKAGETEQTLMYKLEWVTHTKWQFSDGLKSLHEGEYRSLRFTYGSMVVETEALFCGGGGGGDQNAEWHFMAFTIAPDGTFTLYLDGVETSHYAEDMRDFHMVAVESAMLPVVDGEVDIIGGVLAANPGATPLLRLGGFRYCVIQNTSDAKM